MFRITNVSTRVVGLDGDLIMPDESRTISDAVADIPAIKAMERFGILRVEKLAEQAAEVPVETEKESVGGETEATAEPDKPKKTRKPRTKKTPVETPAEEVPAEAEE